VVHSHEPSQPTKSILEESGHFVVYSNFTASFLAILKPKNVRSRADEENVGRIDGNEKGW